MNNLDLAKRVLGTANVTETFDLLNLQDTDYLSMVWGGQVLCKLYHDPISLTYARYLNVLLMDNILNGKIVLSFRLKDREVLRYLHVMKSGDYTTTLLTFEHIYFDQIDVTYIGCEPDSNFYFQSSIEKYTKF